MEIAYDVAVIGGGPAGCSAAIVAARLGLQVLLLEKSRMTPSASHKVCGEFVSPEAIDLVSNLIASDVRHGGYPKITHARIIDASRTIRIEFYHPALSIARAELDTLLWRAAANTPGCTAIDGCEVLKVDETPQAFQIRARDILWEADFALNCTGKWSRVGSRQKQFAERSPKTMVGMKAHFIVPDEAAYDDQLSTDLYLFRGGYCGVQRVDSRVLNVAALAQKDEATSLADIMAASPALKERLRNCTPAFPELRTAPVFYAEPQPTTGLMLNCGDAAGFVDPFSGDGISLATRAGSLAARCVSEAKLASSRSEWRSAAAREYARRYREEFSSVFRNAARFRRALLANGDLHPAVALALKVPAFANLAFRLTRGRTSTLV